MSTNKKYWKSVEHLNEDPELMAKAQNEFQDSVPVDEFLADSKLSESSSSRRDFLKFLGFSVTAASLAACETPVYKAIPYVNKPEEITPGVANWYASSYSDGADYASILVKTREGRPILIEGNKLSKITKGGVNARVNSSVLSLYDATRLQGPMAAGASTDWSSLDSAVSGKLKSIASSGGNIRVLTNSILSPSTRQLIQDFGAALYSNAPEVSDDNSDSPTVVATVAQEIDSENEPAPSNFKHITYDAISHSGMIEANEATFGKRMIPLYNFDQAKVIVSIGADFLGNWLNPVETASDYASRRKPDGKWMSKHFQFEATLSLTGSNADIRGAVKPSEYGAVVLNLYNAIAGSSSVAAGKIADDNNVNNKIASAAKALVAAKGASLVVCGSNDKNVQMVVNGINEMLGNYGKTIDTNKENYIRQGVDGDVKTLISEMKAGKVGGLIIIGGNPAYSMPADWGFVDALSKVKCSVAIGTRNDETASACGFVAANHHYLEGWGDANPVTGHYSLQQPVIKNLYSTRQAEDSLIAWAGLKGDFPTYIKGLWNKYGFPTQTKHSNFTAYWNEALHDGVSEGNIPTEPVTFNGEGISAAASKAAAVKGSEWEAELYAKIAIGEGGQLRNPWLQELPDPVTKITWDNYISMNPSDMDGKYETNIQQETKANTAKATVNGVSFILPVVAAPGQKKGTVGIAVGYGQKDMLIDGETIGQNSFAMTSGKGDNIVYSGSVTIEPTGEEIYMASAQTHHTMMGRKIVNETTLKEYKNEGREGWNPVMLFPDAYGNKKRPAELNLWEDHDIAIGHRWGMTVDLNTCIGCGACATACHAENNVPVVGKDEVRRNRDMHWMRIDRYFSSDMDPAPNTRAKGWDYPGMEKPSDYPQVVFQPVMCQHCNHASCETVCPVAATTHSNEGLNQMAYNRCVGTRYCANNCPYKVRRFNWFNYNNDSKFTGVNPAQEEMSRMVLNPDVVVRSRGVMEKCSMCVQRIQAGKLVAKKAGKKVVDGAIQTACSSACPTNAITFGDINDGRSQIANNSNDDRAYNLLEDVGMQPNVWYMTKVRNADERAWPYATGGHDHGEGHGHGDGHGQEGEHTEHTEEAHS